MPSLRQMTVRRPMLAAVVVAGSVALAGLAHAAETFKMGVIDPIEVMEKTKAGRKALDGLRDYVASRQKVLASDEEEFKNMEKQFRDQASTMDEKQRQAKEAQLRERAQTLQRRFQDFNQELAGKQKEIMDEYMKKIQVATKAVAERGGFSLVVDKGSEATGKIVLFNKETLDLTDQVIKEFDKQNK
jgi:outer membrane protein